MRGFFVYGSTALAIAVASNAASQEADHARVLTPADLPGPLAPSTTSSAVTANDGREVAQQAEPRRLAPTPPPVNGPRTRPDRAWPTAGPLSMPTGVPRAGLDAPAVRIAARPGATVYAPAAGIVVYADHLTMIGLVLIIAHGDEYHSVLAGLDSLHIGVGEVVEAGREVGRMGVGDAPLELHLELHQNGRPVDPLPWLGVRVAGERHS